MTVVEPLDRGRVAALLGIEPESVTTYLRRTRRRVTEGLPSRPGDFPLPDGTVSGAPYWWAPTIEEYLTHRRARGGLARSPT